MAARTKLAANVRIYGRATPSRGSSAGEYRTVPGRIGQCQGENRKEANSIFWMSTNSSKCVGEPDWSFSGKSKGSETGELKNYLTQVFSLFAFSILDLVADQNF